jgi:NTE family protein
MSDNTRTRIEPASPVTRIPTDDPATKPAEGIALCLSGGGYRAMLFALGSLMRLNQLGMLPKLARISSVSGGSITSALLGLKWSKLTFVNGVATNFETEVVNPIREMASTTIDLGSVIGGALLPGTISEWIAGKYAKHLYGTATLQDFPSDGAGPRFVLNATNVQSGVLWRFSKPFMGDYLVGLVPNPKVLLADAVGASSAFPPILSPAVLKLDPASFTLDPKCPLQKEPFTSRVALSDGGVYDNMGIETAWKRCQTVLVCDAGAKVNAEEEPKEDWARHAYRVFELVDNQVRCLRKRQIIAAFISPNDDHDGTYWGVRTNIADYELADSLKADHDQTMGLAAIPTRLKAMDETLQERLINWAYAVCDAAMRKHTAKHLPVAPGQPEWPYPNSSI